MMNYLLDTHIFLWMLSDPEELNEECRKAIQDPAHSVFVSAITGAEIAVKKSIGKLEAPDGLMVEIEQRGLQPLPLHYRHTETLSQLEHHHSDPFDRLLISQAINEQLTLITHDRKFQNYPVEVLWT